MTAPVDVPEGLRDRVTHHQPDPGMQTGEAWLARLPGLVRGLLGDWGLSVDGSSRHGHCALVVPVLRENGEQAVLKVTWPHLEAASEHLALRAWAGHRMVRLLAADPARWALLLERLEPDQNLDGVDIWTSCHVVGLLLAELDIPALPWAPKSSDHLARLADDCAAAISGAGAPGFPRRYLDQARSLAGELAADLQADARLVHSDLHGANVLRRAADDPLATGGPQDWVAIDPKPMAGHPAFAVAPLLWNRWAEATGSSDLRGHLRRRVSATCEAAGLDQELATAYARLRMVRNALWALQAPGPHSDEEVTVAVTILRALEPA